MSGAKKGIVLAGGGSRGSWQAGVLKWMALSGLFNDGFEFVSGTSVGAINAAGIAMFPASRFAEVGPFVENMWTKHITKTSDVWKLRFPLGIPGLWNPSVGISDPIEKLLNDVVDIDAIQASGVQVRFASVDMPTGELVIHTGADLVTHGIKPIVSSASYPLAFPPVTIGEHWLSDGGLRDTAPVGAAIDAGCDDITILTTRDPYLAEPKPKGEMQTTIKFGLRCLSIMMLEALRSDVKMAELHNRLGSLADTLRKHGVDDEVIAKVVEELDADKRVVKLKVLFPSRPLGPSLDFSGATMQEQIALGMADAEAQLGG